MAVKHSPPGSHSSASYEKIFESDEMRLCYIAPEWSEEEMLRQEGIFYLKDVAGKLNMSSADFKKRASDLETEGKSPWEIMGIRKAWTQWIVRMIKFADYFKENAFPRVQEVDPNWDGNTLLMQEGQFYLTEVCDKIPFTAHQIRYQVRRNKKARKEFGVWKDLDYKTYIVDMDIFSHWIRTIWQNVRTQ